MRGLVWKPHDQYKQCIMFVWSTKYVGAAGLKYKKVLNFSFQRVKGWYIRTIQVSKCKLKLIFRDKATNLFKFNIFFLIRSLKAFIFLRIQCVFHVFCCRLIIWNYQYMTNRKAVYPFKCIYYQQASSKITYYVLSFLHVLIRVCST